MKLEGRVVLITGGGSGIGRAIALTFAKEGADVAVNDLNEATANEVTDTIKKEFRRRAIAIRGDVANANEVDAIVDRTLGDLDKVDILINNAGIAGERVPTVNQSVEKWDQVVGIHLRGTYMCCRRVGQWMIKQNGGAILNIASIIGFGGFPMSTSYGPAKAGIINLTQSLAVEWAKHNIRVNSIAPGYIVTPLVEAAIKTGSVDRGATERRTPLGRLGRTNDVAQAALFLVSDDASFITGVTLPVDGGWLAYKYL